MIKKKTLGVYIGRFQPVHRGHQQLIVDALSKFDHLLVLIGSANKPRSIRNPFTYEERESMVYDVVGAGTEMNYSADITVQPLEDFTYRDELWIKQVNEIVNSQCDKLNVEIDGRMCAHKYDYFPVLWGHSKDETSYYLNLFPKWKSEKAEAYRQDKDILSATTVRNYLLDSYQTSSIVKTMIPTVVADAIYSDGHCLPKAERELLEEEWRFIRDYKFTWRNTPFPPTFITTDAVVICSGHVLLIRRKDSPGKGQWALPGGFLGEYEPLVDSMIRELKEETRLHIPANTLKLALQTSHVFDDPHRSTRGRTITHAYYINLKPGKLPQVRGSDDAEKAEWVELSKVDPMEMYEDHYHILQYFIGG